MDLLTGYGSSSDEDDNEDRVEKGNETKVTPAEAKKQSVNSKGKKVLALSAVLPQHILDRLTKNDDFDSDDEGGVQRKEVPKKTTTKSGGKDEGLFSLLSELKSAKPAQATSSSSTTKMGAAFLSVTETSVKGGVRNIHGEEAEVVVEAPARKMAPPVSAAPRVSAAPPPRQRMVQEEPQQLPPSAVPAYQPHAEPTAPPSHQSRKRSRKDIERELRQGNFDAVVDQSSVVTIQQASPDSFIPQPETYAVPQHGIKVATTAMYDPSQGAAVGGLNKGRGKNQINHLMASAASLELQRARQGNSNIGKVQRANAKQKYGW